MHLHWQTMEAVCVVAAATLQNSEQIICILEVSQKLWQGRTCLGYPSLLLPFSLLLSLSLSFCLSVCLSVSLPVCPHVMHAYCYLYETAVVKAHRSVVIACLSCGSLKVISPSFSVSALEAVIPKRDPR